jgi:hypothetical protein
MTRLRGLVLEAPLQTLRLWWSRYARGFRVL